MKSKENLKIRVRELYFLSKTAMVISLFMTATIFFIAVTDPLMDIYEPVMTITYLIALLLTTSINILTFTINDRLEEMLENLQQDISLDDDIKNNSNKENNVFWTVTKDGRLLPNDEVKKNNKKGE